MENFDDSKFIDQYEKAKAKSRQRALQEVEALNLPKKIGVSPKNFAGLESGLNRTGKRILRKLEDEFPENLPYLIGIAVRECHYAACEAAYHCFECFQHSRKTSIDTPKGYAFVEGWAYTLYNNMSKIEEDVEQVMFRNGTPFLERISSQVLLDCMGLYWLSKASCLNLSGKPLMAQKWIFEGLDSIHLSEVIREWNDGGEAAVEEYSEKEKFERMTKRSEQGKAAANLRHDQPGQSRDKKKAIRDIWASGKYLHKDVCAEQECGALNMGYGTARKALNNMPEPPRHCKA